MSRACKRAIPRDRGGSEGGVEGERDDGGEKDKLATGEQHWRRLEAYACKMRELLDEIRRGDRSVMPNILSFLRQWWWCHAQALYLIIVVSCLFDGSKGTTEFDRMLASSAKAAEEARRMWEREKAARAQEAAIRRAEEASDLPSTNQGEHLAPNYVNGLQHPETPPRSVASTLVKSLSDRRAQLLGGEGARYRVGRSGYSGNRHICDQLKEDRKMHERLEAELSNMTKALKSNVQAMHDTLVLDNQKLDQIDTDVQKGQQRLTKINVRVDEQRAANRYVFTIRLT